ncbi:MAG TPA: GAF domain-containing sensor histidine kinase [Egibacteraceae bacterium]|nr:GAF domain-containing sensor histidine kinase [Egibacteraceae bacterium]
MTIAEQRLRGLADAAAALAGELSLSVLLQTIIDTATEVTGARYGALGVLHEDDTISQFITTGADDETIRAIGHYPTGKGILGLLIRHPQVLRMENLASHPASHGFPANHPPMSTFLGAPVRSGGRVYGNLYLTEKDGGFDDIDEQIILVLAAQAGAAIENAQLSDRLQVLAVQDERARISRELHDGVIQSLFSIGLALESARPFLESDPERVRERLDMAVESLDDVIRELRASIFRLVPHKAGELGLARGLTELAREFEVNALVRPDLHIPAGIDEVLPAEWAPELLLVARELLSNCVKHASATAVAVTLAVREEHLVLEVRDNGVGFVPETPKVGRGLDNVRQRALMLGAELDIRSAPGEGSTIQVRVPLHDLPSS